MRAPRRECVEVRLPPGIRVTGRIHTVLGEIEPAALGPTLMHEHTFFDIETSPGGYDAIVDDEGMLAEELRLYAEAGGSGLVDLTPAALGRNPAGLVRLARASGLHIVMGAGWYRGEYHTDDVRTRSADQLADGLVREFRDGVGETGVKPGILGELGTGRGAIRATEERAFRAAARAQREIGFTISTHTTHFGELAFEQIRLLREEGVPDDRIVIGHVGERRGAADVLAIAETGVFVQIDHVGRRVEAGMISDEQRARNVAEVVAAGRVSQVTLSMDICTNSQLHAHYGHGFDHLLRTFVPLLRAAGVSAADVMTMLVDNPRRILAF